ncbi:putative MFS family arabinose efflux permease [Streptomyces sp. 2333.5]|uniref:MFS transporter n=1 Tax=unclassified Streptomyces TaxID=2593676 RepID=UPI0008952529|nr:MULTISPECIES: MFS transporter [unclassified Streptomyces]PJJ00723.1 putative MFS family arabinose efflux permease [Streptomyces sp. 2333.5]SEC09196.1 Predicted arabinose efflux permease, MFS family [Streptomyces sp. 2314.4]SEC99149.1 Predicted arabinose efflux permease, MFS family [Streptomyces sp. 2112.2]
MTHHVPGAGRVGRISVGEDRWSLVVAAGVLAFVAMLDMNVVNVALADIADGLHVSSAAAQWAVLGYQLPVVALLLPVGRWLDGVGLRAAVLTATCGFGLCSAVAAAAPWMGWLIGARLMQGACGAALFVLMPVLAMRAVRPELRGRAMSVPATLGPLGAVIGPAVGGLLLDQWGWRAVFLVKIPFCVLAVVMAWRAMPRDGGLRRPDLRLVADALLVASGVAVLLLALTLAAGRPSWLVLAAAAVPMLWWWLRGPGGRPVAGLLRSVGLIRVHGAVLALAAGFAAMHYVVALHLQRDDGVSATTTGLTVLAFPLGMGLAGPLGGRIADRYGARPVAVAGAALTAAGLLLLVPLGDGWSPLDVAWRLALAGVGMGLNGGPTQALVMSAAPPDRAATAGSTVQFARSLGFALGPALATAAWGLSGPGAGVRAGLALAATAACLAVPLLALTGRGPEPLPEKTTDAAAAAHD